MYNANYDAMGAARGSGRRSPHRLTGATGDDRHACMHEVLMAGRWIHSSLTVATVLSEWPGYLQCTKYNLGTL